LLTICRAPAANRFTSACHANGGRQFYDRFPADRWQAKLLRLRQKQIPFAASPQPRILRQVPLLERANLLAALQGAANRIQPFQ